MKRVEILIEDGTTNGELVVTVHALKEVAADGSSGTYSKTAILIPRPKVIRA